MARNSRKYSGSERLRKRENETMKRLRDDPISAYRSEESPRDAEKEERRRRREPTRTWGREASMAPTLPARRRRGRQRRG